MSGSCRKPPSFLKQVWHRLVGVRVNNNNFESTTASVGTATTSTPLASNFGSITTCKDIVANHRLVFLGEIHSMPPIIAFQRQIQAEMIIENQRRQQQNAIDTASNNNGCHDSGIVHVVMEHFSFEHQDLLDEYMRNGEELTFDDLCTKYQEMGEEGHDLQPYKGLLEDAKAANGAVQLHAGFLPRKYARMWMKEGSDATRQAIPSSQWLPTVDNDEDNNHDSDWIYEGTEFHYNVFESFFTGRSLFSSKTMSSSSASPTDQFRGIFRAQLLKDVAMANRINTIIGDSDDDGFISRKNDKLLVIAGNGHVKYYCGVPERVLNKYPQLASETCLVISESVPSDSKLDDDESIINELSNRYGDPTDTSRQNPADHVYFYNLPEEDNADVLTAAKAETKKAYDKVGESARLPGNIAKAAWIMYNMGYTEEQFHIAGPEDAYNFQGVGNPHVHAAIQPGETVVDIGSGLGVDSFIAQHATGPSGKVIGIDLSAQEVKHSQKRAIERNGGQHDDNIEFIEADMEQIPIEDNSVDVIISNGAFCLAPNKEQAFRELYRILKPGGRVSVCTTTTIQDDLEAGVDWPLCMKMFIPQDDIQPMCEKIGFTNVVVDDTDSSMTMEIPEEVLTNEQSPTNPNRNRVHVGGEDFKHLEDYDMDKICARVCIIATKPGAEVNDRPSS